MTTAAVRQCTCVWGARRTTTALKRSSRYVSQEPSIPDGPTRGSTPELAAPINAADDADPVVVRLAGGDSSRFTIAVTAEAMRLHRERGSSLAVRLTVRPSAWLVGLLTNRTAYATVVLEHGHATCNACIEAAFCLHRAAVNVVAGVVVCVPPRGWTPDADEAALEAARRVHSPGSKRFAPARPYSPRAIGRQFASRFPPDAPSAARYLVQIGGVVAVDPSPLAGVTVHLAMSVHREGVWNAVLIDKGVLAAPAKASDSATDHDYVQMLLPNLDRCWLGGKLYPTAAGVAAPARSPATASSRWTLASAPGVIFTRAPTPGAPAFRPLAASYHNGDGHEGGHYTAIIPPGGGRLRPTGGALPTRWCSCRILAHGRLHVAGERRPPRRTLPACAHGRRSLWDQRRPRTRSNAALFAAPMTHAHTHTSRKCVQITDAVVREAWRTESPTARNVLVRLVQHLAWPPRGASRKKKDDTMFKTSKSVAWLKRSIQGPQDVTRRSLSKCVRRATLAVAAPHVRAARTRVYAMPARCSLVADAPFFSGRKQGFPWLRPLSAFQPQRPQTVVEVGTRTKGRRRKKERNGRNGWKKGDTKERKRKGCRRRRGRKEEDLKKEQGRKEGRKRKGREEQGMKEDEERGDEEEGKERRRSQRIQLSQLKIHEHDDHVAREKGRTTRKADAEGEAEEEEDEDDEEDEQRGGKRRRRTRRRTTSTKREQRRRESDGRRRRRRRGEGGGGGEEEEEEEEDEEKEKKEEKEEEKRTKEE